MIKTSEDNSCRLCLSKLNENNYSSIFTPNNGHKTDQLPLSSKIMVCLSLPVQNNDFLSNKICLPCKDEIMHFYEFRQKCQNAYYMMNGYHRNVLKPKDFILRPEKLNGNNQDVEEEVQDSVLDSLTSINNGRNDNLSCEATQISINTHKDQTESIEIKKRSTEYKCYHCHTLFADLNAATIHCMKCMKSQNRMSNDNNEHLKDKNLCENTENQEKHENNNLNDNLEDNSTAQIRTNENIEDNNDLSNEINEKISTDLVVDMNIIESSKEDNQAPCKYRKKRNKQSFYPCSQCKKSFPSPCLLKRHFMVHTGERPYQCETCGRRFSQVGALNFHKKFHANPPYRCQICNKPFMRPSDIEKHMRSHTGEKPFSCQVCDKKFSQLIAVQQHERIHTGVKPYVCEICGKAFSQSANKRKHVKIHKQGTKPYVCDTCGRSFFEAEEMKLHKAGHGGGKPRECDYCGERFRRLSEIADHVRRFHTFERPHTCAFCSKSFYSLYSLKQHVMIHTGQKPFVCDRCGSKFTQKGNLARHIARKHTDYNNDNDPVDINENDDYCETEVVSELYESNLVTEIVYYAPQDESRLYHTACQLPPEQKERITDTRSDVTYVSS